MIYFIRAEKAIKIGYSKTITGAIRRLKSFQTGNYQDLSIIKIIYGTHSLESDIHKLFKDIRIKGEWFLHDDKLIWFIVKLLGIKEYNYFDIHDTTKEVDGSITT
jgi:hypothetical protein